MLNIGTVEMDLICWVFGCLEFRSCLFSSLLDFVPCVYYLSLFFICEVVIFCRAEDAFEGVIRCVCR